MKDNLKRIIQRFIYCNTNEYDLVKRKEKKAKNYCFDNCVFVLDILVFDERIATFTFAQDRSVNVQILSLSFFFTFFLWHCAVDFSLLTHLFAFAGNIYVCSLLVALTVSVRTFIVFIQSCECIFLRFLLPELSEADRSLDTHVVACTKIFCRWTIHWWMKRRRG